MLRLPSTFFEIKNQTWDNIYSFGLNMILEDENIKWRCISGSCSEEKHFIKKDKQSFMIFDRYILRLPSIMFLK